MPPRIYLDVSTGHLSVATRNMLERFDASDRMSVGWPAMTIAAYPHGWFVTVPPFGVPDIAEQCKALPQDLYDVLCHAYKGGAELVRFDTDGEQIDLPTYEDS